MYNLEPILSFGKIVGRLRRKRPLVHAITNRVVMQQVANAVLAVGASPIMTDHVDEVEDTVAHADVLVLNIGTPHAATLDAMLLAGRKANAVGIPVVLDPVGVQATKWRRYAVQRLMNEINISVIRGNQVEIAAVGALHGNEDLVNNVAATGLDAIHIDSHVAQQAARQLADTRRLHVVATGEHDLVVAPDSEQVAVVPLGHSWLASISGTGCMLSAVIGAFLAALSPGERDDVNIHRVLMAALAGYGLAAEHAAANADGPGTFVPHFLDALFSLQDDQLDLTLTRIRWLGS